MQLAIVAQRETIRSDKTTDTLKKKKRILIYIYTYIHMYVWNSSHCYIHYNVNIQKEFLLAQSKILFLFIYFYNITNKLHFIICYQVFVYITWKNKLFMYTYVQVKCATVWYEYMYVYMYILECIYEELMRWLSSCSLTSCMSCSYYAALGRWTCTHTRAEKLQLCS